MLRPTRLAATTAAVLIPLAVATGSGAPPVPVSADLISASPVAPTTTAVPAPDASTTWAAPSRGILVPEARPALAAGGAFDVLDIPIVAVAAYQRATTIISDVQADCGLTWELLAAIGRVESDHGRVRGATLNPDGTSSPAVRGPVLNGHGSVAAVTDTDAGRYDGNARWDRAVGPMQFLPATWTVVGVDADGDGVRSADDLDDAALGAAVYLCSGAEDLATAAGARAALLRYNHSAAYVTTVLEAAHAYEQGRAASPTGTSVETIVAREQGTTAVDGTTDDGTPDDGPVRHHAPVRGVFGEVRPTGSGKPPKPTPTDPGPFVPGPTDPTPADPEPVPVTLTGVLALCADDVDAWCLGDVTLDFGDDTRLAAAAVGDLDANGVVGSNRDEISGLVGTEVTLGVAAGSAPARVVSVNGFDYADR